MVTRSKRGSGRSSSRSYVSKSVGGRMIKLKREEFKGYPIDFKTNSVGFTYAFDPSDSEVLAGASSKQIALKKAKTILKRKYPKRF